ncbi:MAG TPA: 4Fe-4S dicluster domain-containing protein [Anaerolineae bacterium]|nr:4Fe-4S dicluster domain-containing protein [Anaerolineae bacterium]
MLTLPEKILFILATLATIYAAWRAIQHLVGIISRGQGKPDWDLARKRLIEALVKTFTLQPTWKLRLWPTLFHAFVAWGFMYYVLVNLGDVLEGFIPGFRFLGNGILGDLYRLGADLLSVGVLVGMTALLIRRFVLKPQNLQIRDDILLHPKVRKGKVNRDSLIVGLFILFHVGFRFLGESFKIAQEAAEAGTLDAWQPFASAVAHLWQGFGPTALTVAIHLSFWIAIGLIMLFIPYFPYSKHIHLFFTPLNFLLKPERRSIGELAPLDFEDESIEQFGATKMEDLQWYQLMDAYACIMCLRCQEVCPAYNTGKPLSPAALEINKRYYFNEHGTEFAQGAETEQPLWEYVISEEAVFSCTTCGACVEVCPVGNEPMRDIMDIRRSLVLMENTFPDQWQQAFRGMERTMNPWNVPPNERMKWAEGLEVPTIEDNPEPEVLWWVGCAAATDARVQKVARAFAKILNAAGVNYAVLGEQETCCGDSARRAGNEYLFFELASANVEMLNEINPKRIVTICPHGLHTLKNEYPQFGGHYDVVHHSQFIEELLKDGKIQLDAEGLGKITFHDPCYLGRHNGQYEAPRFVLQQAGGELVEMAHSKDLSLCCGAGGAQMWKEEEGTKRINLIRYAEAQAVGAETVAVGCPFCMIMLNDASKEAGEGAPPVQDIAEIVATHLKE